MLRSSRTMKRIIFFLIAAMGLPTLALAATFPGNRASGFGGAVGTGSLTITDSLSGMTIQFNRGAGAFNDDLVLYLDTQPGGFNDNSSFGDNADAGREAIS